MPRKIHLNTPVHGKKILLTATIKLEYQERYLIN